jgi:hypothetical protein
MDSESTTVPYRNKTVQLYCSQVEQRRINRSENTVFYQRLISALSAPYILGTSLARSGPT